MHRYAKQHSEPSRDKRGAKADELHLTPLELIARIVALATPAQPAKQIVVQTEPAATGEGAPGVIPLGHAMPCHPRPNLRYPSAHRRTT